MTTELIIGLGLLVLGILVLILCNIRIVPQSKAYVMERLGVYSRTWETGLHIKIPFIEKIAKRVELREQILVCGEDFNHGQYHSHERIRGEIANIKNYDEFGKKTEAAASAAGATAGTKGVAATAGSTQTNSDGKIRNGYFYEVQSLGNHNVKAHNAKFQPVITKDNVSMEIDSVVFYQITDPKLYAYGHVAPEKAIHQLVATTLRNIVGGLELDETLTSRELINTKMRTILDEATDAWGIKITRVELRNIIISDVELAEAMEKQMIAERTKRAEILIAEGESHARILKAEAEKKSEILVAEGKAEAIRLVNESAPSQEFLTIRALEAYETAADGKATKIIVPSNLQSLAGLALSGSEVFKEGEKMGE